MEVLTEVPQTGTKLRFDIDREIERPTGDSVMRVQGQSQDGGNLFDAAYVETNPEEADLVAIVLRETWAPSPETQDQIAQEVQATFGSRLSGRDAAQIAEIATQAQWRAVQQKLGLGDPNKVKKTAQKLAEQFERASAKRRSYTGTTSGNGQQDQPGHRTPMTGSRA